MVEEDEEASDEMVAALAAGGTFSFEPEPDEDELLPGELVRLRSRTSKRRRPARPARPPGRTRGRPAKRTTRAPTTLTAAACTQDRSRATE